MAELKNCVDCGLKNDCDAYKALMEVKSYFPKGIYRQIKNIIDGQFNCEYHEGSDN
jgi:hypothetical protein